MKSRKLFAMGLASVMLIGTLAGCGGGNASGSSDAASAGGLQHPLIKAQTLPMHPWFWEKRARILQPKLRS